MAVLCSAPELAVATHGPGRASPLGLAELLQDGDARTLAPYGLPLPAPERLVQLGSCTANAITPTLLARHQRLGEDASSAARLAERFGAARAVLAASGTDAEYTVALAMGPRPYVSVLMDPSEVGSGCVRAATGLPHTLGCPLPAPLPLRATLDTTRLRDARGHALTQDAIDTQVFALAQRHAALPLLLHHVACSKTGLAAPSEAACRHLQARHPGGVRVVVDAAQGRCSPADVQRWLGWGWAVILTGSKFLGAPPFCGVTLLPQAWVDEASAPPPELRPGPGVHARWRLALDTLDRLDALNARDPAALARCHAAWREALAEALIPPLRRTLQGRSRALWIDAGDALVRQGILSFDLGLGAEATRALHRALIPAGFFIGQPVAAGPRHLLRVALGAHTVLSAHADDAHAHDVLARLAHTLHRLLTRG